jgi:hypothetical protein
MVMTRTLHQSQLPPGNNAASSYGISTCLQALMRLAKLARNKTEKKREKMMPVGMQNLVALTVFAIAATVATAVQTQKKYDPGASDTEIKVGNIMPYSGPASAYGTIGKAQAAYFNKIGTFETRLPI